MKVGGRYLKKQDLLLFSAAHGRALFSFRICCQQYCQRSELGGTMAMKVGGSCLKEVGYHCSQPHKVGPPSLVETLLSTLLRFEN
jgi:hypothetical protein